MLFSRCVRFVIATAPNPARWLVRGSCKWLPLSLLIGSLVLSCSRSATKAPGALDSAVPVDFGADLASPETVPFDRPDFPELDQDASLTWIDVGLGQTERGEVGTEVRTVDAVADRGDQEPDSASDAIAAIPCDGLVSAYSAFLAAHRDCSSSSDCRRVGGAGTCNCVATLGGGSGEAISATAANDAYAYLARMQACIKQGFKFQATCDAAPAENLRCEAGKCAADQSSCLTVRG
jgi:hypothetical protein